MTTKSQLEDKFLKLFLQQFSPTMILSQFKSPQMKGKRSLYAYDFFIPIASLLVEVNGGIWFKSGHTSGKGIMRDYDKANQAMLAGYRLLTLDESKINESYCKPYFDYIRACARATANKSSSV